MSWYSDIQEIFIVEDQLSKPDVVALVFPNTLVTNDVDFLREELLENDYLYHKIKDNLEEPVSEELDSFIISENAEKYQNLNSWYEEKGKEIIKEIFSNTFYCEEYSFLKKLTADITVTTFSDYEAARQYIIDNDFSSPDGKINLWLLDRELQRVNHDIDILNLLQLISSKDQSSIGIIYSATTNDIVTREKVYNFIKGKIDEKKPAISEEKIDQIIKVIAEGDENKLFLANPDFKKDVLITLEQIFNLKIDLINLFWVMAKGGNIDNEISEVMKKAKYGFELYNLLSLHSQERKLSLAYALEKTAQLEVNDIEYLKEKSIIEGTNISDTLIRVHDQYSQCDFNKRLCGNDRYLQIIRNIESWSFNNNPKDPNHSFNDLLCHEKFDLHVNEFFRPIKTGDIFEIMLHPSSNNKKKIKYAMLVTPECDCIVRAQQHLGNKIKRKVEMATLIELTRSDFKEDMPTMKELIDRIETKITENQNKVLNDNFNGVINQMKEINKQIAATMEEFDAPMQKVNMLPFLYKNVDGTYEGEYQRLQLFLRKVIHVDYALLDLCTINSNGQACIDFNDLDSIKKKNISLYPAYYQKYLIEDLITEIQSFVDSNGDASTFTGEINMEERNLGLYCKNGSIVDYRLRRIGHLNMPYQIFVQAVFGLTQSNKGLPMEF